jgi:hypothetical protein
MLSGTSALTGEYFTSTSTANLTGFVLERSDSPASNWTFNWGNSAPAPGVPANTFSVRWEGTFTAPWSGTYTFYVNVDNNGTGGASNGGTGGDQLWLNDNKVISSTTSTSPHSGVDSATTTLSLSAGTVYNIRFEYYNFSGPAYTQLEWSSGSNAETPVPVADLFDLTHTQSYTKPSVSTSNPVNTTFTNAPAGWLGSDIGQPSPTGSSSYSGGVYTVNGGGTLVGGTNDQFQYAYQEVTGDFTFIARLDNMTEPNNGAMAGIMVRSGLTASTPEVFDGSQVALPSTTTGRPYDTRRAEAGATEITENAGSLTTLSFPFWLEIVRYGDKITAYYAPDDSGTPGAWVYRTAQDLGSLPASIYIGLAVGSRASTVCTATFDNVSLTTLDRNAETSWLANSFGGGDDHVENDAAAAYVDSSGNLYIDGSDEDQSMSIFTPSGSLFAFGNNSHYEAGSAITADSNFVYQAQIGAYNYDSDGFELYNHFGFAVDTAVLGCDTINGLAAGNGYLYVAANNLIYKFSTSSTATPSLVSMWEADNAGNIAIDPSGNLWIVQNANGSNAADVLHDTSTGGSAGSSITFPSATFDGQTVVPVGITVDLNSGALNGDVYVTDIGPLQQIHIFNSSGTFLTNFGTQFGAYGPPGSFSNGDVTADTLLFPIGVGIDSSGDLYVVGNPPGSEFGENLGRGGGTIIEKFNSYGTLLWERYGLSYVNSAAPDPANPNNVYNDIYEFQMNYNATVPGTEATLVGVLYDPFLALDGQQTGSLDPRVVGSSVVTPAEKGEGSESPRAGVVVREVDGTKFLYDFDQHASAVNIYRFLPNSSITVFCAELLHQTDRYNSTDDAFYIWTDANGDGVKQASEEQLAIGDDLGGGGYEAINWYVDSNGNIWTADSGTGIREYVVQGINSAGAPEYFDDSNTSHLKRWSAPSLFTELTRAVYNAATGSLYLSGYTTTYPRQSGDSNYGDAATELVDYANWATNNGTSAVPTWTAALPYTPSNSAGTPVTTTAIDVAGNDVFVGYIEVSEGVRIYSASTGALVATLPPGPETAGASALLDFRNGMNVTELSNGQYEIMEEEDLEGKTLLYRWTPGVTLPAEGWTDQDVGVAASSPVGFGSFNDTPYGQPPTWTLTGSGTDIGGTGDQFHYASSQLYGDGSITAQVNTLSDTSPGAKAGVMIRDSEASSSMFADVVVTPSDGIIFQWRSATGAGSSSVSISGAVPEYVRISRTGNLYTASCSANGTTWTQIGQQTIAFTSEAGGNPSLAGLAVTSQSPTTLATATFTNVVVANPTLGTPIVAAANPVPGTSTTLSVTGADPSGTSTLTYTWAAIGTPPAPVTFTTNGTNAAQNTAINFTKAGNYTLQLTITDSTGFSVVSTYALTVAQTATSIAIVPAGPINLAENATQQFTATVYDQFGNALTTQPTDTWTLGTGSVGTLSSSGLYTAPGAAGSATVQATDGSLTASVSVTTDPAWLSPRSIATWNTSTHILTVTGAAAIIADPGSDEPIVEASGSAAVITLDPSSGTDIHLGGLSLTDGASATVTSLGSARTVSNYHLLVIGTSGTTPTYTIDTTSTLDLADNDMVILYGSSSPLSSVSAELTQAYDGGGWDKPGLTSSTARGSAGVTALGYGEASALGVTTFDGLALGGNAVLVKYTLVGDTQLRGSVGIGDYDTVLSSFGTAQGWTGGDFHYGGVVGIGDYNSVISNYGKTLAQVLPGGSSPALATATSSTAKPNQSTTSASRRKRTHPLPTPGGRPG